MAKAKPQAEPGIDMDALFEKIDFLPHTPAQWEYCRSRARFNIPCCGRRKPDGAKVKLLGIV